MAQNGSMFTVTMELDGDELTFLDMKEGNHAPTLDLNEEDENSGGIDIDDGDGIKSPSTNEQSNVGVINMLLFILCTVMLYLNLKNKNKISSF